jgi:hypothetical protein
MNRIALALVGYALLQGLFPAVATGQPAPSGGTQQAGPRLGNRPSAPPFSASYADIVDLADIAPLVVRVQPRTVARVDDSRVVGLIPGTGRFYVEAQTIGLIAGHADLAPRLAFLADLPVDAKGRPPVFKKIHVIVFARPVSGRPGELALVAPDALLIANAENEARTRAVLTAIVQPGGPAHITGVREIVHAPGDLAGESQTQVFLKTEDGSAASLTIAHKPGAPTRWGASFSELTANIDAPPQPETLVWYRLACALPSTLPPSADPSDTPEDRAAAEADYRFVIASLGECRRLRRIAGS